jgi:hypothetical protein
MSEKTEFDEAKAEETGTDTKVDEHKAGATDGTKTDQSNQDGTQTGQPKPDEQQGRRRRWRFRVDGLRAEWPVSGSLTLAGTGIIAAAIVVVVYFVMRDDAPSQVEVPDLVGLQRGAAEAELSERGLRLRTTFDQVSDQPPGTVLHTDPPARSKLDRGQGVNLVLARAPGSPTGPAPSTTTQTRVGDPTAPLGGGFGPYPGPAAGPGPTVGPVPGSGAGAGTSTVTVPPAPTSRVPAVVGLDLEVAKRTLAHGGLAVGQVAEQESDEPAGTVLGSSPPAGTVVDGGSRVALVVAGQPAVFLGVGRSDPDPAYSSCERGYQVVFSQQISVTEPTRVTYQWLRSDGSGAPVEHLDFSEPGTKIATTTWLRTGSAGANLTGWERIRILTPRSITGEQLTFSHTCVATIAGSTPPSTPGEPG